MTATPMLVTIFQPVKLWIVPPDSPMNIDLAIVARDLKLPPEKVERTVELLDQGNTIPFITRFP